MAVTQVAFDIPDDIMERLISGEYNRFGGVVRDMTGCIVLHLKETSLSTQGSNMLEKIADAIKKPRNILFGLSVVLVVVGGIVYIIDKNNKSKVVDVSKTPQCVEQYKNALHAYLSALRNADLDVDIINSLILALDDINENFNNGMISIDCSAKKLNDLEKLVYDYTNKLIEANSIECEQAELTSVNDVVIGLRNNLEIQKHVFENVA